MTCIRCKHEGAKRFGTYGKRKIQRFRCRSCKATFAAPHDNLGTHYTEPELAEKALGMMLEGMSVRAISRLTGLHLQTILSLMHTAAERASALSDTLVRDIRPKYVQLDELWTMVGCHGKFQGPKSGPGWGDQWVWLALDSETKMILAYHIGARNTANAFVFVRELSRRTVGRFQITTDALRGYIGAIEE